MRPLSQDLRHRIIAARELGEGTGEVCRRFGVSRKSVERFWKQHRLTGVCRPKKIGGYRPRKLSISQLEILRGLLSQGAAVHGWCNDLWTIKRVVEVIRKHFNIVCSQSNGYQVLTNYLGWSPQRPVTQLRERDNVQIERWKIECFPRILMEAEQRKATLVFVDESGFLLAPTLRRTFAPLTFPPELRPG
jgi:transposase